MDKISVIVPVFNAEKYLRLCVESILAQTYTNIEVLLIDDGSKDASGKICDEYALKDKRVKVVHQENGGSLAARATGIRISQGEFLYFVDSDDKISPDTLECMLPYANDNIDIVVFESKDDCKYSSVDYAKALLSFRFWPVWGKLYRRNLFDEYVLDIPRYFKVGEDFLTNLRLLKNVKGSIVCKPIFKYSYNTSNLSSIQLVHKSSYTYEKTMICEVVSIIEKLPDDSLVEALYRWEILYLGGMIGLQYPIDYADKWITELQYRCKEIKLSLKEQIVMKAIGKPCYRLPLILEKKAKRMGRRIMKCIYG